MTINKLIMAVAVSAFAATSAVAGGFEEPRIETEITEITPPPEPAGGSLPGWVIPAVIVAALIGVASQEDDSDTSAGGSEG